MLNSIQLMCSKGKEILMIQLILEVTTGNFVDMLVLVSLAAGTEEAVVGLEQAASEASVHSFASGSGF